MARDRYEMNNRYIMENINTSLFDISTNLNSIGTSFNSDGFVGPIDIITKEDAHHALEEVQNYLKALFGSSFTLYCLQSIKLLIIPY